MKLTTAVVVLASSFSLLAASLALAQQQPMPLHPTPAPAQAGAGDPVIPRAAATPLGPANATVPVGSDPPTGNGHPFETGIRYSPIPVGARVSFNLQDADLTDLVRAIGNITGRRFIIGSKVRSIKTTVYSPTQVTPAEAYQAFLSVLETNGLTVIPSGRYLKIEETTIAATRSLPTYTSGESGDTDDRFITRIHRLRNMTVDDAATLLAHFKSHDGDIAPYPATNTLIITDTGANIRRMVQILGEVDTPSVGEQIWIERVHYASASDLGQRLSDLLNPSPGAGSGRTGAAGTTGAAPSNGFGNSDMRLARILPDDRTNSLIVVATERMYQRVLELIRRLDVPVEGEGEVHVYYLQHADADEMSTTLNAVANGSRAATPGGAPTPASTGSSAGGARVPGVFEGAIRITADKRTNSLVITSSPRDYVSVRHVIGDLDRARRQVFIEAVVMELSVTNTRDLGVAWHTGAAAHDGTTALGGFQAPTSVGFPSSVLSSQDTVQGAVLGVRGPIIPGTTNLIPGLSLGVPQFGAVIQAMETSGDIDVLSTPSIVATDNAPADINVGQNIATQTNVGGGASSLLGGATSSTATAGLGSLGLSTGFAAPRQEVGTKIHVVPHINDSSEIRMEIEEEISEAGETSGALGAVAINKRNAKTTVVVHDQQTVVIGGLIRNSVTRSTSRIPILGDIPILGALFRTENRIVERRNLLLFMTPYIIRDQSDLRRIFERKMRERQEFLDRYFVFAESQDYHPPTDYSRTNGLVEEIRQAIREQRVQSELEARSIPHPPAPHEISEPIDLPPETPTGPRAGVAPSAGAGPLPNEPPPPPPPPRYDDPR